MNTVGLVANPEKLDAARVLREAVQLFQRAGFKVLVEADTSRLLEKSPPASPLAELAGKCDLLVVLGGDGTILWVARAIRGATTPILSVNLGTLGFLATITQKDLAKTIAKIQKRQYQTQELAMLDVAVLRGERSISQHRALNDAVITRGAFSRLVRIEVTVDGELLTTYTADGLIVSTPTGSTAYSLSAGGPIISPSASGFVITPICPHALSNRSVVVGNNSVIRARLISQGARAHSPEPVECMLSVDGQEQTHLHPLDVVEVRHGAGPLRLVTLPGHSYFEVLRHKLHWSGSNV
jgi:NAD+ kinase